MAETMVFSKILSVRENEKKDAQKEYHQSMKFFEEIATKLYNLLRKKEVAEESYESYLHKTTPIDLIKGQITYLEVLNKQIVSLQNEVQKARSNMESKQSILTDAHVEVKKYEKLIEVRQQTQEGNLKKAEKAFMDEISIQQYLTHKNR